MVSIKNLKQEKLIKKSRDCYKALGVLKNSFKRGREFYIELKLGSVGFLREGKRGKRPLQQRKNQRRNLDLGFQSLAGFGIPQKKFKEFRGPEILITFHGGKCSFPEADPEEGPRAPLFLDRSEAQRALKNIFGDRSPPPTPPTPLPPYHSVWMIGLPLI